MNRQAKANGARSGWLYCADMEGPVLSASPEVMQDRILGKRYFFGAHPSVALGILLSIAALTQGALMLKGK